LHYAVHWRTAGNFSVLKRQEYLSSRIEMSFAWSSRGGMSAVQQMQQEPPSVFKDKHNGLLTEYKHC
jgi:hypothetical protein